MTPLTKTERDVIEYLRRESKGRRPITWRAIGRDVWGWYGFELGESEHQLVRQTVCNIRHKLGARAIRTEFGLGYVA